MPTHRLPCARASTLPALSLTILLAACASPGQPPVSERSAGSDVVRGPIGSAVGAPVISPAELEGGGWLASFREGVRLGTDRAVRWIDSWFGDRPASAHQGLVHGRLSLNTLWREDNGLDHNLRFRAKVDLPNLQEKAYLFIGQDNENDFITDQPDAFTRQSRLLAEERREDQTFFAGLGYALRDNIDLRVGIKGGLNAYAQARYTKRWTLSGQAYTEFRETLFWAVRDGFGLTTAFDYDHTLAPQLALRWKNAATVSQSTDALSWKSSLGLYQALGDQRQLSYEALISGETGDRVRVGEYGLRTTYRQAIHRDWLFGELIVGHFWPRSDDDPARQRSWAMGVGLEMLF